MRRSSSAAFWSVLGTEIVNKSDREACLMALKMKAACMVQGLEAQPQEAPEGDHQANGEVEAAVREIKKGVRALKASLESRLKMKLADSDPVLSWIPRHAADLINRYRKGEDGKTAEQRMTGKAWRKPAIEFGERLMFKEAGEKRRKNAFEATLEEGRYVGHSSRNGALLVLTSEGAKRGVGIRRLPEDERWTTTGWDKLKGFPWEVAPRERQTKVPTQTEASTPITQVPEAKAKIVKRGYVMRSDIDNYGFTDHCPGCVAIALRGKTSAGHQHNDECFNRIVKELEQDAGKKDQLARKRRRKRGASEAAEEPEEDKEDQVISAAAATGQPAQEQASSSAARPAGSTDSAARLVAKRLSIWEDEMDTGGEAATAGKRPRQGGQETEDVSPSVSMSGSAVRPAGPIDAEDLADTPVPMEDETGPQLGSLCSLEAVASGVISGYKAELLDEVRFQVASQFRRWEMEETSLTDVDAIASLAVEMGAVDIAEVYSPHRFSARAEEFQLRPGFAADLEELKPDGAPWDLSRPSDVAILAQLQKEQDPYLLTGSPPCELFSQLQAISWSKQDPQKREQRWALAKHHLKTATDCYWRQIERGRIFLHEHPWSASSWSEPEIVALSERPDVYVVKGPMCRWEMTATDRKVWPHRTGYVRKETGWMTNSKELAELLEGICSNVDGSRPWHKHVHLIGGLGKAARIYPPKLVEAVLKVLHSMLRESGELSAVEEFAAGPSPAEPEMPSGEWQEFWDHVNGGYLDTEKVQEARRLEREWIAKQQVYEVVARSMCLHETGKQPIPLRWIDTNKGDHDNPNYRSRQVVREIKARKKLVDQLSPEETFSSMPPLEALMLLTSLFMTEEVPPHKVRAANKKLGIFDIKRAHFYGKARRRVFVELDEEDRKKHGSDKCGLLLRSMYGTQDASAIWQDDYCELLGESGFCRGRCNGAVFYHPGRGIRILVHGDDFVVLTDCQEDLDWFESIIKSRYEYKKLANLGWAQGDDRTATVLNRIITLVDDGSTRKAIVEPDARHAQLIISGLGLAGGKGCETPAEKRSNEQQLQDWSTPRLDKERKMQYRSLTMRAAYLAQDRVDLSECTKNLARFMQSPHEAAWQALKRLGRYLKKYPCVVREFPLQKLSSKLKICTDSDHAGCAATRKSTTGLVALLGQHCIRHGSNMQSTIALSSGESEFYALVKASSTGLGLQSLLGDWGISLPLVVMSDSSAARGHVSRRESGNMRHIQTRYLWLQERVGEGHVKILAISGKVNPSDMLTKALSGVGIRATLQRLGFVCTTASEQQKALL